MQTGIECDARQQFACPRKALMGALCRVSASADSLQVVGPRFFCSSSPRSGRRFGSPVLHGPAAAPDRGMAGYLRAGRLSVRSPRSVWQARSTSAAMAQSCRDYRALYSCCHARARPRPYGATSGIAIRNDARTSDVEVHSSSTLIASPLTRPTGTGRDVELPASDAQPLARVMPRRFSTVLATEREPRIILVAVHAATKPHRDIPISIRFETLDAKLGETTRRRKVHPA